MGISVSTHTYVAVWADPVASPGWVSPGAATHEKWRLFCSPLSLLLISLGVSSPLKGVNVFTCLTSFVHYLCKFAHNNFFPSGATLPLEGVTRGGPPVTPLGRPHISLAGNSINRM